MVFKVHKALKGHKDHEVMMDQQEIKDGVATKEYKALKGHKDYKVI